MFFFSDMNKDGLIGETDEAIQEALNGLKGKLDAVGKALKRKLQVEQNREE